MSIRSHVDRCVDRYRVHCVQTCGCVCNVLIDRIRSSSVDIAVSSVGTGAASRQWCTAR